MNKKLLKDYGLYARSEFGISSNKLNEYEKFMNHSGGIGYYDPNILEERELNVTQMSVYSRLFMDKILFLGTEVNSDIANILNSQMMYLNMITDKEGGESIKLFINSPGGSVTDGLAIYDVMNFVEPDIETYCLGSCASMASIILSSGTSGKRYSLPNGEIMIHQVSGGTGITQCADIQIAANRMQRDQDTLFRILAENTGKDIKEIEEDADRDHWFTPEEALKYGPKGLIDKVIKKSSMKDDSEKEE